MDYQWNPWKIQWTIHGWYPWMLSTDYQWISMDSPWISMGNPLFVVVFFWELWLTFWVDLHIFWAFWVTDRKCRSNFGALWGRSRIISSMIVIFSKKFFWHLWGPSGIALGVIWDHPGPLSVNFHVQKHHPAKSMISNRLPMFSFTIRVWPLPEVVYGTPECDAVVKIFNSAPVHPANYNQQTTGQQVWFSRPHLKLHIYIC